MASLFLGPDDDMGKVPTIFLNTIRVVKAVLSLIFLKSRDDALAFKVKCLWPNKTDIFTYTFTISVRLTIQSFLFNTRSDVSSAIS